MFVDGLVHSYIVGVLGDITGVGWVVEWRSGDVSIWSYFVADGFRKIVFDNVDHVYEGRCGWLRLDLFDGVQVRGVLARVVESCSMKC